MTYNKKIMYHGIECPNCGNEIVAKSVKEPQKCRWCRRLYSVQLTKRKGKFIWEAEPVDFDKPQDKIIISTNGIEGDRGPTIPQKGCNDDGNE